jgi:hypothetical protein
LEVRVLDQIRQALEPDDGERGELGLGVSVVERPDGKVWLVFDDLRRAGTGPAYEWLPERFFTRLEVEMADVLDGQLDQETLANIGLAIAARLAARRRRPP